MNPTDEQIEAAAKAMCAEVGENWQAQSSNETHSGNSPEEMRDGWLNLADIALTAAGVKPRVKPLVWEEISDRCWDADGLGKLYRAMLRSDGDGTLKHGVFDRGTDYVSIEVAKAAAQADYEARILSALTTEGE